MKISQKIDQIQVEKEQNGQVTLQNTPITDKMEEKMEKTYEDLKKERENLEKTNPELLVKTEALAKSESKPRKQTPKPTVKVEPKKEVRSMDNRTAAELLLAKVCKDLKLAEPRRINAKADSKSGVGAVQAFTKVGIKVAVRSNDVVLYTPQPELGYGVPAPSKWAHYVTVMKHTDKDLEKAFRKTLKDSKSSADWRKEGHAVAPKTVSLDELQAKKKALEEQIKAIKKVQGKREEKKDETSTITVVSDPVVA